MGCAKKSCGRHREEVVPHHDFSEARSMRRCLKWSLGTGGVCRVALEEGNTKHLERWSTRAGQIQQREANKTAELFCTWKTKWFSQLSLCKQSYLCAVMCAACEGEKERSFSGRILCEEECL